MTTQAQTVKPTWREWLALAALTVPIFMLATDMTVLFLALPSIAADLAPSATQQLWTLHISDLLSAGLVLTAGTFADRLGPKRLLLLGMVAYGVISLIAAFAPNAETLILARGLIAVAAVTIGPTSMVLLRHMFPSRRQFATAIAVYMAAFTGGSAFGPPFGGLLLEHFWWGAIFLANIPVAVFVLAISPLLPSVPGTGDGRIDLMSIGLSLSAVVLVVFGFQELAANGLHWTYVLSIAAGLVLGAVFVRRQLRLPSPLFDLKLFTNPGFPPALGVMLLFTLAGAACYMQLAQYLQAVLGLSPLHTGLLFTISALFQMVAASSAPVLLRWMTPARAIAGGAAVSALGAATVLTGTTLSGDIAIVIIVAGDVMISVGAGPAMTLGSSVLIASAPVGRTGSATGAQDASTSMGSAMGLAMGGSLAVLFYKVALAAGAPAGLDPAQLREAGESVGRAMIIAQATPGALGTEFVGAVRDAFTMATRAVYAMAIALIVCVAVVASRGLRGVRLDDETEDENGLVSEGAGQ